MKVQPRSPTKSRGVNMTVYGTAGAGKTRLLGSSDSILIIRPPTDHTDSIPPPATGVEELVIAKWEDVNDVMRWGQQGKFKDYKWVGFDSATLFEDHGLDDVFADAVTRKPHRAEHGPDKGEYGVNRARLMKWIRDMVGLCNDGMFNFVVTANVMGWTDPVKEVDMWAPMLGSPANPLHPKLCGYMNIVAYLQANKKEGKERQETLTVDSDGFVGKDQYNSFPELKSGRHGFINPTMADIEAAIAKARKPQRSTGRKRTTTGGRRRSRSARKS